MPTQLELPLRDRDWRTSYEWYKQNTWFMKKLHVWEMEGRYYVSPTRQSPDWISALELPDKAAADSLAAEIASSG